jgi:hypothetical protein
MGVIRRRPARGIRLMARQYQLGPRNERGTNMKTDMSGEIQASLLNLIRFIIL